MEGNQEGEEAALPLLTQVPLYSVVKHYLLSCLPGWFSADAKYMFLVGIN